MVQTKKQRSEGGAALLVSVMFSLVKQNHHPEASDHQELRGPDVTLQVKGHTKVDTEFQLEINLIKNNQHQKMKRKMSCDIRDRLSQLTDTSACSDFVLWA